MCGVWLPALRRPAELTRQVHDEPREETARGTAAPASEFNPEKGKLLVLSIGADYKRHDLAENACKKDAERLAEAFQNQQGVFFKHVNVTTLLNEQAKKDGILSKLDEIRKEATDGDLVVVTLAGHGTVDEDNNYFFLPYDYDSTKVLASTGVSWDDFHRVFRPLHCMVLVIADTCHSGAITRSTEGARDTGEDSIEESISKAVNDFRQAEAGLIVIAASLAEGVAKQNRNYGYLSQAVYEGVTGERTRRLPTMSVGPSPIQTVWSRSNRCAGTSSTACNCSATSRRRSSPTTAGISIWTTFPLPSGDRPLRPLRGKRRRRTAPNSERVVPRHWAS